MTDQVPDTSPPNTDDRRSRRQFRGAIAFGIVMATVEMGALLYFAYC
jgi:hypothetical protein